MNLSLEETRARSMAANLAARRKAVGLTQKELAARANVAKNTVSRIEQGLHVPRALTRQRLQAVIDAQARFLYREAMRLRKAQEARDAD